MPMSPEIYRCYGHALLAGLDMRQSAQRAGDVHAQADLFVGYTKALDELHAVDPGRAQALDLELDRLFDLNAGARDQCLAETCRLLASFGFQEAADSLVRRLTSEELQQALVQELAPTPTCVAFFPDPPGAEHGEPGALERAEQPAPAVEDQLTFDFDVC